MIYKDECDICHRFDVLTSIDNKCICSECIKAYNQEQSEKQVTIFDLNNTKEISLFIKNEESKMKCTRCHKVIE